MQKTETYIVYSKTGCEGCDKTLELLKEKGKNVLVKKFDEDSAGCKRDMGKLFREATTIPQVFVVTAHLNGFDEVKSLMDKLEEDDDYLDNMAPWEV